MTMEEQYAFEVAAPALVLTNVDANAVKSGKLYMVNLGADFRFPIHPEPNNDHKISKLLRQHEVIITNGETNPDNEKYYKTILPVTGWIRRKCVEDGTLVEVTKETYNELKQKDDKNVIIGTCLKCLRSNRCCRSLSNQVRKHPIYLMAGYLLLQFLAEVVIFADLITDVGVAVQLAKGEENWLFMLTCVFMLAPYYIAWAAAFGYLQKRAMESTANNEMKTIGKDDTDDMKTKSEMDLVVQDDEENTKKKVKPKSSSPDKKIQIGVILFAIAPIGVLFLILLDIYLLFEDFIIKPIWLCCSHNILRNESHAEKGYKKLRRVSEVVAETICQTVLQLYIAAAYPKAVSSVIDIRYVYVSLITSVSVLILWSAVLWIEARGFGLHFYEYVTVVLQGSFNFVPYLPAIERGKKTSVNWTDFRFDSHSVGLVSKALISPECNLKQIKLSGYSLDKLSTHECKFLGQMLADSPKDSVNVVFSRSRKEIEELFKQFDTDKSRTFTFDEFVQLCAALRQNDDGVVSVANVAEIFSLLADSERDEVYLTDLLWKLTKSTSKLPVIDYDSPVMYALKERNHKLLTFMIAAKVCDDLTWSTYTTTLVTTNRHIDALMMCEEKGIPVVVEIISGKDLPGKKKKHLQVISDEKSNDSNNDTTSDPYCSVSVAGKVKRTETVPKNLNPVWRQPLLFIIPPEDIPTKLGNAINGGHGIFTGGGRKHSSMGRQSHGGHDNEAIRRRKTSYHNTKHKGDGPRGHVGSTAGRLEINMRVYDYDFEADDEFLGSYKHIINWTESDVEKHEIKSGEPRILEHTLKHREKRSGALKFRVHLGTLQYYIKWGRKEKI